MHSGLSWSWSWMKIYPRRKDCTEVIMHAELFSMHACIYASLWQAKHIIIQSLMNCMQCKISGLWSLQGQNLGYVANIIICSAMHSVNIMHSILLHDALYSLPHEGRLQRHSPTSSNTTLSLQHLLYFHPPCHLIILSIPPQAHPWPDGAA